MGYYEFPHTRNYDTDLGYLIDWFKTNKNKIEENTAITIEKALTATEEAIKAYNSATSASNSAALALELKNQTEALKNLMQDKIEQIDTNTNRINNLATIDQGSITTTADAELVDIRVGANGITYPSAGDSVRGQFNELEDDLGNLSDISKLQKYVTKISLIAGQEFSGPLIGVFNPILDSGYITIQFSKYIDGLQWAIQRKDGSNIINSRLSANKTEFNYVLNEPAYGIGFYVPSSSITESTTVDIIVIRNDNNYIEPTIFNNVDLTSGISTKLETKGGNLILKKGIYNNKGSIAISEDSMWLVGEVWNYPNHPNGVYESDNGCKIKMNNYTQPLIKYTNGNGVKISNIGLNGTVANGDTYDLFKFDSTNLYCGIEIPSNYADQFEISKVSFTGLGVGISGNNNEAMLDAFIFDKLNTDGCDFGIYLNINLIVYAKIMNSIMADTLGCGMYFNSPGANGVLIENNAFVRNGGNFSPSQLTVLGDNVCAVYLATLYDSIISKNFIHYAGTYKDTRDANNIITTYQDTNGLVLMSHKTSLVNNSIIGCKKYGAILNGNYNLYSGNEMLFNHNGIVVKGNNNNFSNNTLSVDENDTTTPALTINGYNNVVSGNNFLNGYILVNGSDNIIHRFGNEKIVLSDSAWNNTLIGFDESQITAPTNHGTIIK